MVSARNRALQMLARRKEEADALAQAAPDELRPGVQERPVLATRYQDDRESLLLALPESQREVVLERVVGHHSYAAMADRKGTTEGAIKDAGALRSGSCRALHSLHHLRLSSDPPQR